MKNPNGYGTIKRIAGNRRRPYALIITEHGVRKTVSYHETREAALIAQADRWKEKGRDRITAVTFSELYSRWLPLHIARHEVSASAVAGYRASFSHCRKLWSMDVKKVRYAHVQAVIDDMQKAGLSYSSRKKCRSLINLLFDFARMNDYCQTSFKGLIFLGKNRPVRPHRAMTRQQINRLWRCRVSHADTVLILLYTGLRVSELLKMKKSEINMRQKFMRVTSSKTISGIRAIPIHPLILPIVKQRMQSAGENLITEDGQAVSYARYRKFWMAIMQDTRGKYTPHDTRHTFASLLDAAEVNDNARKRLLGHAGGNVTDGVYTHKNLRQLRAAIEKIH